MTLNQFLLSAKISSQTLTAKFTVLLDTRASGNFINMRLTRSLDLKLAPEKQVLGATSNPTQCTSSRDPLLIKAASQCFQELVRDIPDLMYPFIVDLVCWRDHAF